LTGGSPGFDWEAVYVALEPDQDRVKPCLKCDELIPFKATFCPHCKSEQAAPAFKSCPRCAASITKTAIYCPHCGKLAAVVAPSPTSSFKDQSGSDVGDSVSMLSLWSLEALALACLVWVVVDYMIR
jgi:RNA polymerase subunit RPABC4/transcription elongation factor Spt4